MPDNTYRGTTLDPEWPEGNLTGGNDSGASAADADGVDRASGPDRTARILDAEGSSAAGFPGPDPTIDRPLEEPARRVAHDAEAPPAPDYGKRSVEPLTDANAPEPPCGTDDPEEIVGIS